MLPLNQLNIALASAGAIFLGYSVLYPFIRIDPWCTIPSEMIKRSI